MNKNELERLLKSHHTDGFRWALQCCSYHRESAEEVLQMSYLKILEGKAVYKERSTFKTWLFSVIRFTAFDFLKKEPISVKLIDTNETSEFNVDTKPDYRILLNQLSNRQQQVLLLTFYYDLSLSDVAKVMSLSIGTVRTHYQRGKENLKVLILKQQHGETG